MEKIIHQIWLGKNKPVKWLNTFKKMYSDYEYILWNEDNLPSLYNQEFFDKQELGCAKSDILRYEILYRYGGVYFDADMICLKKIPDSFFEDEFFTAYESEKHRPGIVNNGFMGCCPKHPVIKKMLEGLKDRDEKLPPWRRFGPGYLTETLENYNGKYKIYESKYFHPVHFLDKRDEERLSVAYTDHQWGTTRVMLNL